MGFSIFVFIICAILVFFFVLVGGITIFLVFAAARGNKGPGDPWHIIAKKYGLTYAPRGFGKPRKLTGTLQSVPLKIRTLSMGFQSFAPAGKPAGAV